MTRIQSTKVPRTIAVFPTTHGFGYVIFEGPLRLIDWGVKHIPRKDQAENLKKFEALLEWFEPDLVILENVAGDGSHKGKRVTRLIRAMARRVVKHRTKLESHSRAAIRQAFSEIGVTKKHEIAQAIARDYQELAPFLPNKRRIWEPEDARMAIFDAASLALTSFHVAYRRTKVA